jgi:hypothetical protein
VFGFQGSIGTISPFQSSICQLFRDSFLHEIR